ncbi:MAG: zinc-dependent metalloprotease family protein, partial [Planctomycetota bacterium]
SVLPDGLHAMILMPDGARMWIQPAGSLVEGAADNLHAVYHDTDVLPSAGVCGVNEAWLAERQAPPGGDDAPLGGGGAGTGGCSQPLVAELACDADFEYFQDWGSVPGVENRINTVINVCNLQYESDVGITHEIVTIIVRTSEPDPYTTTSPGALLDQLQLEWTTNQAGVARDVVHLFTGKNLNGGVIGIAWTI